MGDMRNKIAKIERAIADKKAMESFLRAGGRWPRPAASLPADPRCACGHTYYDVPDYWMVSYKTDRWAPTRYFCKVCIPDELRAEAGL